jgi:hypothetical protein
MASEKSKEPKLFGFRRPHPAKPGQLKSHESWATLKALSDLPNSDDRLYWRIYDGLYDLTTFDHPGGNDWITMTRGNDITELFESYHPNIQKPKQLLSKYFKSKINEKRNSDSFTFEPNGFYSTFRQRAWEILKIHGTGPTLQMLLIHDSLLLLFLTLLTLTINPNNLSFFSWFPFSLVSGFVLQCLGTCCHNFYHQKDNWRMYSWDLTPASSYEWRISHGYSHHTFPNTAYDYEIMIFRPFLYYFPIEKSLLHRLLIPGTLQIVAMVGMHLQVHFLPFFLPLLLSPSFPPSFLQSLFIRSHIFPQGVQRYFRILVGQQRFRLEHTLPFVLWLALALVMWCWSETNPLNAFPLTAESVALMKQVRFLHICLSPL